MDKNATDFALMAGAFSRDGYMARQVCALLAERHINETMARKMLRLIGEGKLVGQTTWYYPYVFNDTGRTIASHWTTTATMTAPTFDKDCIYDDTLTNMARSQLEPAA